VLLPLPPFMVATVMIEFITSVSCRATNPRESILSFSWMNAYLP
jgi:hypothetical protein